jgi:hypothetical protein
MAVRVRSVVMEIPILASTIRGGRRKQRHVMTTLKELKNEKLSILVKPRVP